jgi:tetratricopeptide (TPR) repeat protein
LGQVKILLSQLEDIYCQQFGESRLNIVIEKFDDRDYSYRGITYHQLNDHDKAITDYDEAIRLNPKNSVNYVMQGLSYQKKGIYDQAMANYNRAIRLNDEYKFLAYQTRGDLFIVTSRNSGVVTRYYNNAISDYKKSLDLNPNQSYVHKMLGLTLIAIYYHNERIARVKEARKHLHIAIELDPNLANDLSEDLHNMDYIIQLHDKYSNKRNTTTD